MVSFQGYDQANCHCVIRFDCGFVHLPDGIRGAKEEDSVLHQIERLRAFGDYLEKRTAGLRREDPGGAGRQKRLEVYLFERWLEDQQGLPKPIRRRILLHDR